MNKKKVLGILKLLFSEKIYLNITCASSYGKINTRKMVYIFRNNQARCKSVSGWIDFY